MITLQALCLYVCICVCACIYELHHKTYKELYDGFYVSPLALSCCNHFYFFDKEDEAVAFLMNLTRLLEGRLLRDSAGAKTFFASYRGVAWHRRNRKWIAQAHGKTLGVFKTQLKAAATVSRCLGVEVKSLKKAVHIPKAYAMRRFQLILPIFQHSTPGDLASARAHAVSSRDMFASEPVLEFVSLMSKYGPFKDVLHQAWQASRCQGARSLRHVISVIGEACIAYSKLDEEVIATWIAHCGVNVSHHMGPLPLCRKLGVVVPSRGHAKGFRMGKQSKYVRLASTFQEMSVALARLKRVATFMAKISVSRSHGLGTWQSYCEFSEALAKVAAETSVPGLKRSYGYTKLWLARSFAFAASSQCSGVEKITTEELAAACPDAKGWLCLWPRISQPPPMSMVTSSYYQYYSYNYDYN